mmetsp:Transcript_2778/g.6466  ORF Transcript_2778/g.6466 Transcript_2778/m.6466 type:complete len:230 (-) Transcript_2778:6-695(-)
MSSAMFFSSLTPSATCSSASSICWSLRCSCLRPSAVSRSGSSVPPVGTLVAVTLEGPAFFPPEKSSTRASVVFVPYRLLSRASHSSMCLKTNSTSSCRCSACCTGNVFPFAFAISFRCSSRSLLASSWSVFSCWRILCDSWTVAFDPAVLGRSSSCSRSLRDSRTDFTSEAMCALSRLNSSPAFWALPGLFESPVSFEMVSSLPSSTFIGSTRGRDLLEGGSSPPCLFQ